MNEPVKQSKEEISGAKANAEIHDSTGRVLAIAAFGIACMALGASVPSYIQSRDTRSELLQEIQRSENRVLADNEKKQTAFALLDNHYSRVLIKLESLENQRAK